MMSIIELRDELNKFIERGHGDVTCIGERSIHISCKGSPYYDWRYLEDVNIVNDDNCDGTALNLIFE